MTHDLKHICLILNISPEPEEKTTKIKNSGLVFVLVVSACMCTIRENYG